MLVVLALLFVAGPLALLGQERLRALQLAVAQRQANDLVDYAVARAASGGSGGAVSRCPRPDDPRWSYRTVEIDGQRFGAYAVLPLRARRGLRAWCVAARTAGGALNEGQRVEVYYRIVTGARGRVLEREALP